MATKAVVATMLLASAALASNDATPVRYHHQGMTVIMRSNTNTIPLVQGDNQIGTPTKFTCGSAGGCALSMSASLHHTGGSDAVYACLEVDGVGAAGACNIQLVNPTDSLFGGAKVTTGEHSISLIVNVEVLQGDSLTELVEEYRIYERRVKGAN